MMFFMGFTFVMEIIALAFGGALLVFAKMNKKAGTSFARFIAWVVIILAILSMVCTSYQATKYGMKGSFDKAHPMQKQMHHHHQHK